MEGEDVTIDWEHTEYKWLLPSEVVAYDTVPGFGKLLADLRLL
jgi:hypothetical protein